MFLKQIFQFIPLGKQENIAIAVQQQRASEPADETALRIVKDSIRKAQKRTYTGYSII